MEPENRLVARTLEKNWEAALCEQRQLLKDDQEFQRPQPLTLSDEQRELIHHLAEDIPALWASPTTTPQDRQQIVRMLIERIELNIQGDTEQTEITLFWHGGSPADNIWIGPSGTMVNALILVSCWLAFWN